MDVLSSIDIWKLCATIVTIIVVSLIYVAANYWSRRRLSRAVKDIEDEAEEDTRTPEELFEDKLFNEEYDAALQIAKIHGLDTDLVYQKQWIKSDVTIEAIDDLLSKVRDQKWIIGECLERIPQDLATNKYLLDFAIELIDSNVDFDETEDFYQLSSDRRETVIYRKRLILFRERLSTFEHIIGGNQINFNATLYEKFRRQELFESCLQFAREGDHRAMATMFTFHGAALLEHWLPLLSQIPEVVRPFEYRSLLPEAGLTQNEEDVYPWEEAKPREPDWCEKMLPDPIEESPQIFYASHPHLVEYRGRQLTKSMVSKWFCVRSRQIERCTSLISNSLELVQLGIERNFPDLAGLNARLDTFATLIYDCLPRAEDSENSDLTFEQFSKLSSDEIVQLLMSGFKKDPKTFIKCLRQSLIPYLIKYDSRHGEGRCQGSLENFLVNCAKESLHLVRAVFEQSVPVSEMMDTEKESVERNPIITNVKDLLNLAARCINECTNENFLSDAFAIIECLPQRSDSDPPDIKPLQDEIDKLENNLAVIELLEKNGCKVLMSELTSIQKNPKDVKRLFTEMIRKGSKRTGFKILEEEHWRQLLNEAMQVKSDCFSSTISESEINEIFIKTLLSYGKEENFDLAYNFIKNMDTSDLNQLILDCSKDYVNSAGSTGDKTIGLAKKCLNLLPKETLQNHPDVKEELDLISAIEIIDEFWMLPLLPVQIRLMDQPRIQLIYHLLQHNKAYKQVSRVLHVAQLARVCLDSDPLVRDGTVLIILGEAALDDQDYKSCFNVCELLMDREYSDSWQLCLNLALNINNLKQKMELLSFSLTFCEEENNTAKRINQILQLIEETRTQLEQEYSTTQSSLRGHQFNSNLINLDVLSAGAQLGEDVVVKTASHLTSWLLPTLKNIRSENKMNEKSIKNEVDKKVNDKSSLKSDEADGKSELILKMKLDDSVETDSKENNCERVQLNVDDSEEITEKVQNDSSFEIPSVLKETCATVTENEFSRRIDDQKELKSDFQEKEGWDIDEELGLESSTESSVAVEDDEAGESKVIKEPMKEESGWEDDEELKLDLDDEEEGKVKPEVIKEPAMNLGGKTTKS